MTIDEISALANRGEKPESALGYEWLLWYRLREIYRDVRHNVLSAINGQTAKDTAVNDYRASKREHERSVLLWKRIEAAGVQYAKSRTLENADAFFRAVYMVSPAGGDTA